MQKLYPYRGREFQSVFENFNADRVEDENEQTEIREVFVFPKNKRANPWTMTTNLP